MLNWRGGEMNILLFICAIVRVKWKPTPSVSVWSQVQQQQHGFPEATFCHLLSCCHHVSLWLVQQIQSDDMSDVTRDERNY